MKEISKTEEEAIKYLLSSPVKTLKINVNEKGSVNLDFLNRLPRKMYIDILLQGNGQNVHIYSTKSIKHSLNLKAAADNKSEFTVDLKTGSEIFQISLPVKKGKIKLTGSNISKVKINTGKQHPVLSLFWPEKAVVSEQTDIIADKGVKTENEAVLKAEYVYIEGLNGSDITLKQDNIRKISINDCNINLSVGRYIEDIEVTSSNLLLKYNDKAEVYTNDNYISNGFSYITDNIINDFKTDIKSKIKINKDFADIKISNLFVKLNKTERQIDKILHDVLKYSKNISLVNMLENIKTDIDLSLFPNIKILKLTSFKGKINLTGHKNYIYTEINECKNLSLNIKNGEKTEIENINSDIKRIILEGGKIGALVNRGRVFEVLISDNNISVGRLNGNFLFKTRQGKTFDEIFVKTNNKSFAVENYKMKTPLIIENVNSNLISIYNSSNIRFKNNRCFFDIFSDKSNTAAVVNILGSEILNEKLLFEYSNRIKNITVMFRNNLNVSENIILDIQRKKLENLTIESGSELSVSFNKRKKIYSERISFKNLVFKEKTFFIPQKMLILKEGIKNGSFILPEINGKYYLTAEDNENVKNSELVFNGYIIPEDYDWISNLKKYRLKGPGILEKKIKRLTKNLNGKQIIKRIKDIKYTSSPDFVQKLINSLNIKVNSKLELIDLIESVKQSGIEEIKKEKEINLNNL